MEDTSKFTLHPKGNERILLVDDEQILADVWKALLEHLGYRVTTKTSSLEALNLFRTEPGNFDLLITDHKMDGLVGLDLAREVRGIRPDIPIILCSGNTYAIDRDEVKRVGIQSIMMKPFDLQAMAQNVRTVLETNDRTKRQY